MTNEETKQIIEALSGERDCLAQNQRLYEERVEKAQSAIEAMKRDRNQQPLSREEKNLVVGTLKNAEEKYQRIMNSHHPKDKERRELQEGINQIQQMISLVQSEPTAERETI